MKKQIKRLKLSRETVRDLDRTGAEKVVGGTSGDGTCLLATCGCATSYGPHKCLCNTTLLG